MQTSLTTKAVVKKPARDVVKPGQNASGNEKPDKKASLLSQANLWLQAAPKVLTSARQALSEVGQEVVQRKITQCFTAE